MQQKMQQIQFKITLCVDLGQQNFYITTSWLVQSFFLPVTAPQMSAAVCCKSHLGLLRPQNLFLTVL